MKKSILLILLAAFAVASARAGESCGSCCDKAKSSKTSSNEVKTAKGGATVLVAKR